MIKCPLRGYYDYPNLQRTNQLRRCIVEDLIYEDRTKAGKKRQGVLNHHSCPFTIGYSCPTRAHATNSSINYNQSTPIALSTSKGGSMGVRILPVLWEDALKFLPEFYQQGLGKRVTYLKISARVVRLLYTIYACQPDETVLTISE